MRILNSVSHRIKGSVRAILKKTGVGMISIALAIAGGILAQNMITSPDVVSAATPSDACFDVGW